MTDQYYKSEAVKCPGCGYPIDSHACTDPDDPGGKPGKDDLSLCVKCLTWHKYDDNVKLLPLTPEDISKIDPETIAHMAKVRDKMLAIKSQKLN